MLSVVKRHGISVLFAISCYFYRLLRSPSEDILQSRSYGLDLQKFASMKSVLCLIEGVKHARPARAQPHGCFRVGRLARARP